MVGSNIYTVHAAALVGGWVVGVGGYTMRRTHTHTEALGLSAYTVPAVGGTASRPCPFVPCPASSLDNGVTEATCMAE